MANTIELNRLTLSGFKSFLTQQTISIGPLTLLSGANSSGKSSITQALLLLKQTIEAPYDPGALMLNGPNVKATSAIQLLSRLEPARRKSFKIGFVFSNNINYESIFERKPSSPGGFDLKQINIKSDSDKFILTTESTTEEIKNLQEKFGEKSWSPFKLFEDEKTFRAKLGRDRSTFVIKFIIGENESQSNESVINFPIPISSEISTFLQKLIHVPGLRGNPERMYATTAAGQKFPGRFETYIASIIMKWQEEKSQKFEQLNEQLQLLGLTASLITQRISDTEVEISVSRHKTKKLNNSQNFVSIADVGFGVSQVLPVLVALLVAEKGQTVIIEQPELHLHPRAQTKLAEIIAKAVSRGVRAIIETHSSLLLIGIQTVVAKNILKTPQVALNWFSTNENGHTRVSIGDIDENGSIGEWPTDFMDVRLDAESAYLDAVEQKIFTAKNAKP